MTSKEDLKMPAVSKKQQRYFGYLLSNPEERKKKGISKKAAKDFAQDVKEGAAWTKKSGKNPEGGLNEKGRKSYERDNPGSDLKAPQPEGGSRKKSFCARMGGMKKKLTSSKTANDPDSRINKALRKWKCNEVAPPGWGHTKAEKEKTKPWKPKSKIGGTAAAFKRALDDGRFKGLPGSTTKKEKTADMFKLMWSMKKKGDKPHYKPGTDKKYKKYQDESFEIDTSAHKKAQKKAKMRNLAKGNTNPNEKAAAEKKAGGPKLYGESISTKDTKKLNKASALSQSDNPKDQDRARARQVEVDYKDLMRQIKAKKKMRSEEASYKQRDKELKKAKKAMDFRHKTIHKGGDDDVNEATTMKDNNLFGNAYAGSYETLKKKIGSKKKHDKPAIKEGISYKDFMSNVQKGIS